jgi:hypothetical protein
MMMAAEWMAWLGEMNGERLKTFQPDVARSFQALRARLLDVAGDELAIHPGATGTWMMCWSIGESLQPTKKSEATHAAFTKMSGCSS